MFRLSEKQIDQFFCRIFQIVMNDIAGIVQIICNGSVVADDAALFLKIESTLQQFVDGMVEGVEKDCVEFQSEPWICPES